MWKFSTAPHAASPNFHGPTTSTRLLMTAINPTLAETPCPLRPEYVPIHLASLNPAPIRAMEPSRLHTLWFLALLACSNQLGHLVGHLQYYSDPVTGPSSQIQYP